MRFILFFVYFSVPIFPPLFPIGPAFSPVFVYFPYRLVFSSIF